MKQIFMVQIAVRKNVQLQKRYNYEKKMYNYEQIVLRYVIDPVILLKQIFNFTC